MVLLWPVAYCLWPSSPCPLWLNAVAVCLAFSCSLSPVPCNLVLWPCCSPGEIRVHSLSFSGWNCFPPFALFALFFRFAFIRVHSRLNGFAVACCLLPVACCLFPVTCPLYPVPCTLYPVT